MVVYRVHTGTAHTMLIQLFKLRSKLDFYQTLKFIESAFHITTNYVTKRIHDFNLFKNQLFISDITYIE